MQVETAKLEETVEKILREKPEVIINALRKNPEILKQVIADSLPHNVATKDDIKMLQEEIKLLIEMINRRFEDINRRFEDMNKRFEDMKNYTDKKFDMLLRIIITFDIALLGTVITLLLKSLGLF